MFKELNTLKIFLENPTKEFSVREVARILKISPATASSRLREFAKRSVLIERKERMLKLYKANVESDLYKDIKIFYNIRKLKESGLMDELNKFYLKPTIVLFGSYSKGLDTETSDIDLLVISEKRKLINLTKFEKKLKRKIQLFVVEDIKELKNEHLINSVLNGITLQGMVKWI